MATITVEKNTLSDITSAAVVNATEVVKPKRKSLRKPAVKKDAAPAPEAKVESKDDAKVAAFFEQAKEKLAAKGVTVAPAPAATKDKAKDKPAAKVKTTEQATPAEAATTAPAASQFVAKKAEAGQTVYSLNPYKRPGSGRLLFAHTHAALTVLGMLDASHPVVDRTRLLALIGATAVGYHVGQRNMELTPKGVRLTILGYNKFNDRARTGKFSPVDAAEFQSVFLEGKPSDKLHIGKADIYSAFSA